MKNSTQFEEQTVLWIDPHSVQGKHSGWVSWHRADVMGQSKAGQHDFAVIHLEVFLFTNTDFSDIEEVYSVYNISSPRRLLNISRCKHRMKFRMAPETRSGWR